MKSHFYKRDEKLAGNCWIKFSERKKKCI